MIHLLLIYKILQGNILRPNSSTSTHIKIPFKEYGFISKGTISLKKYSRVIKEATQFDNLEFNTNGKICFSQTESKSLPIYSFSSSGQVGFKNQDLNNNSDSNEFNSLGIIELDDLPQFAYIYFNKNRNLVKYSSKGTISLTITPSSSKTLNYFNFVYKGKIAFKKSFKPQIPKKLIQKQSFVCKTIEFLTKNYWISDEPEKTSVIKALEILYDSFNIKHLLIVTGNIIFSTNGFLNLKDLNNKSIYCARGLFMIENEANYNDLASYTQQPEFYTRPELLSYLSENAIKSSIKYFKYRLHSELYKFTNLVISFDSVLNLFSVKEDETKISARKIVVKEFRSFFNK